MKIDRFMGNILSVLLNFFIVLTLINKFINNFQVRKKLIYGLFKNFEINTALMLNLRVLQEKYNEVEYRRNPDFNDVAST